MFLPKDYKEPTTNNYMKFVEGANKFRVLSSAIVGNEYWVTEKNDKGEETRKPIRKKLDETIPVEEVEADRNGQPAIKHFWALVVYNWNDGKIQILEITQRTIQRSIKALTDNEKWGDPKEYDIVITRTGEGLETEYNVTPEPKEKLMPEITKEYKSMNINLNALYDGEDPFGQKEEVNVDEIPDFEK